jgi:hypothetical protein
MPKFLQPYAKAVVAVGGIALLIWLRAANITVPGIDALVMDMIVGALVSLGVYQVRNA